VQAFWQTYLAQDRARFTQQPYPVIEQRYPFLRRLARTEDALELDVSGCQPVGRRRDWDPIVLQRCPVQEAHIGRGAQGTCTCQLIRRGAAEMEGMATSRAPLLIAAGRLQ
jgi:hypothetical protein